MTIGSGFGPLVVAVLLLTVGTANPATFVHRPTNLPDPLALRSARPAASPANDSAVSNFSAALGRLVTLVGVSGGALLALVWARVGISWFSNDVTKKIQAKDRARDALVGTLLFVAAISGLFWGLARWVIGGG
ncbi:MAG: hypothetical protein L3K08_07410 [Thermoplasmata archaeon]|nr:hypothetical protein [Thermoplasmata archaeon]